MLEDCFKIKCYEPWCTPGRIQIQVQIMTMWMVVSEKILTKYWIYKDKMGEKKDSLRMLATGENPIY